MRTGVAVALALGVSLQAAAAQSDHWVATWATAQELSAGGRPTGPPANLPPTFADQTVRMIARPPAGDVTDETGWGTGVIREQPGSVRDAGIL